MYVLNELIPNFKKPPAGAVLFDWLLKVKQISRGDVSGAYKNWPEKLRNFEGYNANYLIHLYLKLFFEINSKLADMLEDTESYQDQVKIREVEEFLREYFETLKFLSENKKFTQRDMRILRCFYLVSSILLSSFKMHLGKYDDLAVIKGNFKFYNKMGDDITSLIPIVDSKYLHFLYCRIMAGMICGGKSDDIKGLMREFVLACDKCQSKYRQIAETTWDKIQMLFASLAVSGKTSEIYHSLSILQPGKTIATSQIVAFGKDCVIRQNIAKMKARIEAGESIHVQVIQERYSAENLFVINVILVLLSYAITFSGVNFFLPDQLLLSIGCTFFAGSIIYTLLSKLIPSPVHATEVPLTTLAKNKVAVDKKKLGKGHENELVKRRSHANKPHTVQEFAPDIEKRASDASCVAEKAAKCSKKEEIVDSQTAVKPAELVPVSVAASPAIELPNSSKKIKTAESIDEVVDASKFELAAVVKAYTDINAMAIPAQLNSLPEVLPAVTPIPVVISAAPVSSVVTVANITTTPVVAISVPVVAPAPATTFILGSDLEAQVAEAARVPLLSILRQLWQVIKKENVNPVVFDHQNLACICRIDVAKTLLNGMNYACFEKILVDIFFNRAILDLLNTNENISGAILAFLSPCFTKFYDGMASIDKQQAPEIFKPIKKYTMVELQKLAVDSRGSIDQSKIYKLVAVLTCAEMLCVYTTVRDPDYEPNYDFWGQQFLRQKLQSLAAYLQGDALPVWLQFDAKGQSEMLGIFYKVQEYHRNYCYDFVRGEPAVPAVKSAIRIMCSDPLQPYFLTPEMHRILSMKFRQANRTRDLVENDDWEFKKVDSECMFGLYNAIAHQLVFIDHSFAQNKSNQEIATALPNLFLQNFILPYPAYTITSVDIIFTLTLVLNTVIAVTDITKNEPMFIYHAVDAIGCYRSAYSVNDLTVICGDNISSEILHIAYDGFKFLSVSKYPEDLENSVARVFTP